MPHTSMPHPMQALPQCPGRVLRQRQPGGPEHSFTVDADVIQELIIKLEHLQESVPVDVLLTPDAMTLLKAQNACPHSRP